MLSAGVCNLSIIVRNSLTFVNYFMYIEQKELKVPYRKTILCK